jgi:hypothetical protein
MYLFNCIFEITYKFWKSFPPQNSLLCDWSMFFSTKYQRVGGHTRLLLKGWGSPNSNDWRNALHTAYSVFFSIKGSLAAGTIYLSRAVSGLLLEYYRRLPVCIFMADLGSLKKVDKKGFSK